MLTDEGRKAARECLMRSSLPDPIEDLADTTNSEAVTCNVPIPLDASHILDAGVTLHAVGLSEHKKSIDVPLESLERVCILSFSGIISF